MRLQFSFFATVLLITVPGFSQEVDKVKDLLLIAEQSIANREVIRPFSMRFLQRAGAAATMDAGLELQFTAELASAECELVEDDQHVRLSRNSAPGTTLTPAIDDSHLTAPFLAGGYSEFSGQFFLNFDSELSGHAQIESLDGKESRRKGFSGGTPLDGRMMGRNGMVLPGQQISDLVADSRSSEITVQNVENNQVRVVFPRSDGRKEVTFDRASACLPVEVRVYHGDDVAPFSVMKVLQIRKVERGWIPEKVVRVWGNSGGGNLGVDLYEVTSFDQPATIPESQFALTLPKNTIIGDGMHPKGEFRISKPVVVDATMASRMLALTSQDMSRAGPIDLMQSETQPYVSQSRILWLTLPVILLVLILVYRLRRQGRTA